MMPTKKFLFDYQARELIDQITDIVVKGNDTALERIDPTHYHSVAEYVGYHILILLGKEGLIKPGAEETQGTVFDRKEEKAG